MPIQRSLIFAAALAGLTPFASAQGLLDQQLGPPQPATTAPTPLPAAAGTSATSQPAQPRSPTSNDIISPDAVKKVDDADLIQKLIQPGQPAPASSTAGQQAKDMVSRMGESQSLLQKRDPGPVTQETQRRILTDLDVLIEIARKQEQSSGSGQQPQDQQPGEGQSRQQANGQQPGNNTGGGSVAARQSILPGGSPGAASSNGTDIHDTSNDKWGDLPPRDRDLVAHGANEEYLPSYRDMIDAYYKNLAEMSRNHNK